MPRTCFYEVLGVEYNASNDELKQAFRQKALLWHPDKCRDLPNDQATARFQALQEAYETLSDPQERAWYDGHRADILGDYQPGQQSGLHTAGQVNIWRYFSRGCFTDFNDDSDGFYSVFDQLFRQVDMEDIKWSTSENDRKRPLRPNFGTSKLGWDDHTAKFYKAWSGFTTNASFAHATQWKISPEQPRDMRRLMDQENRKLINRAKREYTEQVRKLIDWCKRRDPRVLQHQQDLAQERSIQAEVMAEQKEEQEREYRRLRESNRQAELERQLHFQKEKEELKKTGQVFLDDNSEDNGSDSDNSAQNTLSNKCVICRKVFKSGAQMNEHLKSKKHLQLCKKAGLAEFNKSNIYSSDVMTPTEQNDQNKSSKAVDIIEELKSGTESSEPRASDSDQEGNLDEMASEVSEKCESDDEDTSSDSTNLLRMSKGRSVVMSPFEMEMNDCLAQAKAKDEHESRLGDSLAKFPSQKKGKKGGRRAESGNNTKETVWKCLVCQEKFTTRNQLMRHVEAEGHAALKTEATNKKGGKTKLAKKK